MGAVSAVAWHLLPAVARWARSGVPADVLEDLDAELVAEALAAMADRPGLPADRLAQLAWQRVSGWRRTERSRAGRQVSLDERSLPAVAGPAGRVCLTGSHRLVALAALSGWDAHQAAARLGTTPAAWRARASRTRRFLRAETGIR